MKIVTMDGNEVASYTSYFFTEVSGIYPITPSSPMAENTEKLSNKGVKNIFGDEIRVVIPGKAIGGQASTIIDLTGREIKLIRKGPIPLEELNLLIK